MDKQKTFEKVFREHLKVESYSKSIDSLYSPRSKRKIDYSPYYQRNYVWDRNKATYFIESILLGTEIPPLIFFNNNSGIEVIDGRQRFETILRFMENDFALTNKGLSVLTQLGKLNWERLGKNDNQIVEEFLLAKLRIIEFQLVNEPPLDKFLEDHVKKEIFSRYNSGITPLKKAEVDSAIYDEDPLNSHFRNYIEEKSEFREMVSETFMRQYKTQEQPIENIMSFIRRSLVMPRFPINYFARGSSRTEFVSKLYQYYSDSNIGNENKILNSYKENIKFLYSVKQYSLANGLSTNRLAMACFLWGLGVLELEEASISLDDELINEISIYVDKNISKFTEVDSNYAQETLDRFLATSLFFSEKFGVNFDIYITADDNFHSKIKDISVTQETKTKLSELESLRLNKPVPSDNSIDDVRRAMTRRRFLIRPSYQRKEVINPQKASAIIESILLGIKLPPIFLYKKMNGVMEVIDGQQRLLTLLGFIGEGYINEKGEETLSKNHQFSLRKLRILKDDLNGKRFSDLPEELQDKIYDFPLSVVEIDERQNPFFNPIDLFIRLNDKPYPIRENSFEMWNSWADIEIIKDIRDLRKKLKNWFYVKNISKPNDRDRMENEELLTSLCYISYYGLNDTSVKTIDIYQKTDRINARISTKARVSSLLQLATEDPIVKNKFVLAFKDTKSFINKIRIFLLDKDVPKNKLENYLSSELDRLFKGGKKSRYFRRRIQDFYFLWLVIDGINLEMVKFNRLDLKNDIFEIFHFLKNMPELFWNNSKGTEKFYELSNQLKEKYKIQKRALKLDEEEKLELIRQQGSVSSISGAPIFLGDEIEVDHKTPIALGGADTIDNMGVAHKDENRSKGSKKNKQLFS